MKMIECLWSAFGELFERFWSAFGELLESFLTAFLASPESSRKGASQAEKPS
jgi:hypothetical protein